MTTKRVKGKGGRRIWGLAGGVDGVVGSCGFRRRRGWRSGGGGLVEEFFELDGEIGAGGVVGSFKAQDGMTGAVEDELGEVPVDGSAGRSFGGVGEEIDEWDGVDAGERGGSGDGKAEVLFGVPGGDGGGIGQLLVTEVGGGNAKDDEAAVRVGFLKLGERWELRGVDGLAGEVDDEQDFAAVGGERLKLAAGQDKGEIPGGEVRIGWSRRCCEGVKTKNKKTGRKNSAKGTDEHRLKTVSH